MTMMAASSFHIDASKSIVKYEWDFDGDGVCDETALTPAAKVTLDVPMVNRLVSLLLSCTTSDAAY